MQIYPTDLIEFDFGKERWKNNVQELQSQRQMTYASSFTEMNREDRTAMPKTTCLGGREESGWNVPLQERTRDVRGLSQGNNFLWLGPRLIRFCGLYITQQTVRTHTGWRVTGARTRSQLAPPYSIHVLQCANSAYKYMHIQPTSHIKEQQQRNTLKCTERTLLVYKCVCVCTSLAQSPNAYGMDTTLLWVFH